MLYTNTMNTLTTLERGGLALVTGDPARTKTLMQDLAASAAAHGRVCCLIGGNRFSPDAITYALASRQNVSYEEAMGRLQLSRAFTCYQLAALLRRTDTGLPTLVFDLLSTFADENANDRQVEHLLRGCLNDLHRISRRAPVVVSAHTHPNREHLLEMVRAQAGETLILEAEQDAAALQMSMF
ncbi:MAG: hypothetical protein OEV06_10615 [Anaerolineae bacterium]|nr:hypothetical protein [Anaerolineae bacterium]